MTPLRVLIARLLSLVRVRRLDRSLDEEIRAHLDLAADEYIRRGLSLDEARLAALRHFGGVTQVKEAYRDRRGLPALDAIWQDARYAWRGFRRTPGFTAVALTTLTLATGSTIAVFSLLNALAFRELPVREPRTLVQVMTTLPTDGATTYGLPLRPFLELTRSQSVFSGVIGSAGVTGATVEIDGLLRRGTVWGFTANAFSELGVQPIIGRFLVEADEDLEALTATPVAVLGYRFWQQQFAGRMDVVGRRIDIEGVPFTVVGVAPEDYSGLSPIIEPQITVPLLAYISSINGRSPSELMESPSRLVELIGRLEDGHSVATARAQIETLWPQVRAATVPVGLAAARRDEFLSTQLRVRSFAHGNAEWLRSRFVQPLWILFGTAGVLLLVACVNLAGLALARATARRHEMGIRTALGAGRWRLIQQGLTEGLILAVLGTAAGIALGYWAAQELATEILGRNSLPGALDVGPDARVIAVASAMAIASSVFIGLTALRPSMGGSVAQLLGSGARVARRMARSGPYLVGTQVALSLALLLNAGLLVRTISEIGEIDPGYQASGVFVVRPEPRPLVYRSGDNDAYYPTLVDRLLALPSVRAAGITQAAFASGFWYEPVASVGAPADHASVVAALAPISPGVLETLRIPVVEGRDFLWTDNSKGRSVAMLSRSLADHLFPGGSAVGRHIRVGARDHRQRLEVVGVVADTRLYDRKNADPLAVYVPSLQEGELAKWKAVVIRADQLSIDDVRRAIDGLGREYVTRLETLSSVAEHAILRERLTARLAAYFGGLTLLLASIGLYGLISYGVKQRHKEIAIRLALGARPARIIRAIVSGGLAITLVGAIVGLGAGLLMSNLFRSLLFGVSTFDAQTLIGAPLLLIMVALAACFLPAARAARVQPTSALRMD
jgi:predicted permease